MVMALPLSFQLLSGKSKAIFTINRLKNGYF